MCCDPPSARIKVKAVLVSKGVDPDYCDKFFAFMDEEGLIFAPESLRAFVQDIVTMAKKHDG